MDRKEEIGYPSLCYQDWFSFFTRMTEKERDFFCAMFGEMLMMNFNLDDNTAFSIPMLSSDKE